MRAVSVRLSVAVFVAASLTAVARADYPVDSLSSTFAGTRVQFTYSPVYHAGWDEYAMLRVYGADGHPMNCLRTYRDFEYRLVDLSGQIVPHADLGNYVWRPSDVFVHPGAFQDNCSVNFGDYVVELNRLYPKLPPGKYFLYITMAGIGLPQVALPVIVLEFDATNGARGCNDTSCF